MMMMLLFISSVTFSQYSCRSHHKTTLSPALSCTHTHTKNTNDRRTNASTRTNERVLRGCHRRVGRRCEFHRLRATGGYDFDEGTKRVDSIIVRGGGGEYDYYFHVIIFIVERRKRSRYGNDSKRAPICLSRRWVQSVLSRSPGGDDGDSVAKYAPLCRVRRRRAMEQNIDG